MKFNILYVGLSDKKITSDPNLTGELTVIRNKCNSSAHTLNLKEIENPILSDLAESLEELRPNVFHISGHGSAICSMGNDEAEIPVFSANQETSPTALHAILKELESAPEIVILSCCQGVEFAEDLLFGTRIQCIVSFPTQLTDQQAEFYFATFYQELLRGSFPLEKNARMADEHVGLETKIFWNNELGKEHRSDFRLVDPPSKRFSQGSQLGNYRLVESLQDDDLSIIWRAQTIGGNSQRFLRIFKFAIGTEEKKELSEQLTIVKTEFSDDPSVLGIDEFDLTCETPFVVYFSTPGMTWTTLESYFEGRNFRQNYPFTEPEKVVLVHRIFLDLAEFYQLIHSSRKLLLHGRLNASSLILQNTKNPDRIDFTKSKLVITDLGLWPISGRLHCKNKSLSPSIRKGESPRSQDDILSLASLWYRMLSNEIQLTENVAAVGEWLLSVRETGLYPFGSIYKIIVDLHKREFLEDRTVEITNGSDFATSLLELLKDPVLEPADESYLKDKINHKIDRLAFHTTEIGLKFIQIPAGDYSIGPNRREKLIHNHQNEGTASRLHSEEYSISATPLTNKQAIRLGELLCELVDESKQTKESKKLAQELLLLRNMRDGDLPLTYIPTETGPVKISWEFAKSICDALTHLEKVHQGKKYFLPTEAQWEIACRAGNSSFYNIGSDNLSCSDANYLNVLGEICEVKKFNPNGFGCYQFHGNVWEYCDNIYEEAEYQPSLTRFDPGEIKKNLFGIQREFSVVIRGGDFQTEENGCRSSARSSVKRDLLIRGKSIHRPLFDKHVGIRIACAIPTSRQ